MFEHVHITQPLIRRQVQKHTKQGTICSYFFLFQIEMGFKYTVHNEMAFWDSNSQATVQTERKIHT